MHFRNATTGNSTILDNLESNQLYNIYFFQNFVSKQFGMTCSGSEIFFRNFFSVVPISASHFSNYNLVTDVESKCFKINL